MGFSTLNDFRKSITNYNKVLRRRPTNWKLQRKRLQMLNMYKKQYRGTKQGKRYGKSSI